MKLLGKIVLLIFIGVVIFEGTNLLLGAAVPVLQTLIWGAPL